MTLKHPHCKLHSRGLGRCQPTTNFCVDLVSPLMVCRIWSSLNFDYMTDHDGQVVLPEALMLEDCALGKLGLDKSVLEEEAQMLLQAVGEKSSHLTIPY